MNLLFFAGSLRQDSCNKKFVREAMRLAEARDGISAEYLDLKEYPMPPYDGDIEAASGLPETTTQLGARIKAADALVISAPEYNGSVSGALKNVIDWLSREKPVSLAGKPLLLLGASPGALGAVRGLWQTRIPFEALGVHVFPHMMGLPKAYDAFDAQGRLQDDKPRRQLEDLLDQFIRHLPQG